MIDLLTAVIEAHLPQCDTNRMEARSDTCPEEVGYSITRIRSPSLTKQQRLDVIARSELYWLLAMFKKKHYSI